jgi:uncharacterized membrane protein YkvA (DUF1232 family)
MSPRLTPWISRTGLLRTLLSHARVAVRLIRDPAVPVLAKILPVAAILYVVSPLDLIPDVLPIVGQLDDLTFLIVALEGFLKICPAAIVAHHRDGIARGVPFSPMAAPDIIDAEWRRG